MNLRNLKTQSEMSFTSVHGDTVCNCLQGAIENHVDLFCRVINSPELQNDDFLSYWELGKRDADENDCHKVCLLKGVSTNKIDTPISEHRTLNKYLTTIRFSPKRKKSVCKFKFHSGSGLVKHTPNQNDPYHYTFYKTDDFSITDIDVLEIKKLEDYVQN